MSSAPSTRRAVAIGEIPLDSPRAHAINVVKTAGGFSRLGLRTTLLTLPPEHGSAPEVLSNLGEPGLAAEFPPPSVLNIRGDRAQAFGRWAAGRAAELGAEVVYARHFDAAVEAASLGLNAILETHAHAGDPNPKLLRALASTREALGLRAISTISPVLRDDFVLRGGNPARIGVVPDGVDVEMFEPAALLPPSPFAANPGPHAVYCGHLYDYKGIPTILAAAVLRPAITWHLVGGMPEDIERVTAAARALGLANLIVHGRRPYSQVPAHLWHADVLLLPPSADHASAAWTSPVKLGEYLASGRAIVASAIPGLRTWVAEPAVRWFTPDDPDSLADAVDRSLRESPSEREFRAAAAANAARSFGYERRARAMLDLTGVTLARQAAA